MRQEKRMSTTNREKKDQLKHIHHKNCLAQMYWMGAMGERSDWATERVCYWIGSSPLHSIPFHFMALVVSFFLFGRYSTFCDANFIDILLKLCLHIIELCRVYPIPNYENRFTEAYLIIRTQHALNCKNCTRIQQRELNMLAGLSLFHSLTHSQ